MVEPLHFVAGELFTSEHAKENRGAIKALFSREYFSNVVLSATRFSESAKLIAADTPHRSKTKKIIDCSKNLLDLAIRVMPYVCVIASVGCLIGAGFAGPAAPALLAAAPILVASGRVIQKYVEARDKKAQLESQSDASLSAVDADKSPQAEEQQQSATLAPNLTRQTTSQPKIPKRVLTEKADLAGVSASIKPSSQSSTMEGTAKPAPQNHSPAEAGLAAFDAMMSKDREIAALKQRFMQASSFDPSSAKPKLEKLVRSKYDPMLRLLIDNTKGANSREEQTEYRTNLEKKVQAEVNQLQREIEMERARKNEKRFGHNISKKIRQITSHHKASRAFKA